MKKTSLNKYIDKLEDYALEKEVVFKYLLKRLSVEEDEERKKKMQVMVDQAEQQWIDSKELRDFAKNEFKS